MLAAFSWQTMTWIKVSAAMPGRPYILLMCQGQERRHPASHVPAHARRNPLLGAHATRPQMHQLHERKRKENENLPISE